MSVLFVSSDVIPHLGGKSSHIMDLTDGLSALGVSSDIVSLATLGRRRELAIKARLGVYRLMDRSVFNLKFQTAWRAHLNRLVLEACARKPYEVISVQDAFAASSIARAVEALGVTTVLTMHTYFGLENGSSVRFRSREYVYQEQLARELAALGVVHGVIAVDDRIRSHVLTVLDKSSDRNTSVTRVTSIPNFVNISVYRPPQETSRSAYRAEFGLNESQFAICCARRLVEKNGVLNAVRAMIQVTDDSLVLLIAGDGPESEAIKDFIARHGLSGRVRLLGALSREGVLRLYQASDASVVPSITVNGLQEATSISAIEAMACGVSTVVSDIGGLSQLIQDGETGLLCPEGDVSALASAFLRLRRDEELRHRLSAVGRKHIETNHSHLGAASRYLSEFERCSEERQGV